MRDQEPKHQSLIDFNGVPFNSGSNPNLKPRSVCTHSVHSLTNYAALFAAFNVVNRRENDSNG